MKKQNVRTLSFIVSTLTYLLVGAAIFDALESPTEEMTRFKLEASEKAFKKTYNISNNEYETLEDIVKKFHFSHFNTDPQWKFTGAFYFSLTVITTIGYGHSTPQTIPGKMFCMFYAIIGIPLCLVMFQAVGERLNYFTSWTIQVVKKTLRLKNSDVSQTELVFVGGVLAIVIITGGAAIFTYYEGWSYFNSIYYCVVTLTTIGFGDLVALQGEIDKSSNLSNIGYVVLSLTFILFGLTVVASAMNLLVLKFLTMNTDDERREEFTREAQRNQSLRFSNADLLNVVNGNVICSFEPADLEDLRRENSFTLCCNTKNAFLNLFSNKLFRTPNTNTNNNNNNNENSRIFSCCNCNKKSSSQKSISNYEISDNTRVPVITQNKKKQHYTVKRAPGKISHLLPNERVNSIITKNDNESMNLPNDYLHVEAFVDDDELSTRSKKFDTEDEYENKNNFLNTTSTTTTKTNSFHTTTTTVTTSSDIVYNSDNIELNYLNLNLNSDEKIVYI